MKNVSVKSQSRPHLAGVGSGTADIWSRPKKRRVRNMDQKKETGPRNIDQRSQHFEIMNNKQI